MKESRPRDMLSSCMHIRAEDKIRKLATLRNDLTILTVTAEVLIAKEACYHITCYKDIDDEFSEVFKLSLRNCKAWYLL